MPGLLSERVPDQPGLQTEILSLEKEKKYTEKYFSVFFFYFNALQMVFFNDRVISFEKFKANQDFIIIHTLKKFPRTSDIFNQSLKVKSNQIFFF